jgi:vitamin B12 transporter
MPKIRLHAARRAHFIIPVFATMTALPSSAFADDLNQSATALPPLVVSATRLPTPEDQIASSVTVITADDIAAKQLQTLPDALNDVPGLNVVQTGGPGGQTSVFMRGTNSNHTKILIDGIDVSDPSTFNATYDLSNLLLGDVERIEVLRGPQSGLYGSDAIGGVISITTKSGDGPLKMSGSVEGGSFGTVNESGSARGSTDRFSYSFDVQHYHSDDTDVTPPALLPPGQRLNPDAYDNTTLSTKLGAKITDNFDIGVVARYTETTYNFTGDNFNVFPSVPDVAQSEEDTRQMYTRGFGHLSLFDGRFDQTFGVAYTNNRTDNLSPGSPNEQTLGERVKVDYLGTYNVIGGETLSFGAEHFTDSIDAHSNGAPTVDADITTDAGFVTLQSSYGDRLFNTASLRYDSNDRFGDKTTYHVAPEFVVTETGTTLKGSVGTGFKAPSLEELYESFPPFFFANSNLKPETSFGWDVGFEQAFLEKRIQFGATYFHNDIRNLIEDNASFTTEINIDKATTYGVESFIAVKPLKTVTLRADYTYTMAKDDTTEETLLRRPKHKASLNASWQATDNWSFASALLYVGPWIDVDRAGTESGISANGYTTLNLNTNYDLNDHWSVFARIDNALDRHYQDPVGFQHQGIGGFGGVRATF